MTDRARLLDAVRRVRDPEEPSLAPPASALSRLADAYSPSPRVATVPLTSREALRASWGDDDEDGDE